MNKKIEKWKEDNHYDDFLEFDSETNLYERIFVGVTFDKKQV